MSAFIPCGDAILQPEAVPAIKILHFNGHPKADQVYAYARIYVSADAFHYSFLRFEEFPCASVRFGLAIGNGDNTDSFVFLSIGFNGFSSLGLYTKGVLVKQLPFSPPKLYTSGDEQGVFNAAEGTIALKLLQATLCRLFVPGEVFAGNFFSFDIEEAAFGSAFSVPLGESVPTNAGFRPLLCIPFD